MVCHRVTRVLPTLCGRRLPSVLWCMLVAVLAANVAAPRQVAALCAAVDCEESGEDRDSDEAAGEQELSLIFAPASPVRRTHTVMMRPQVSLRARRIQRAVVETSLRAELAHRNGLGGPLRC